MEKRREEERGDTAKEWSRKKARVESCSPAGPKRPLRRTPQSEVLCKFYAVGACRHGAECVWSHDRCLLRDFEVRPQPPVRLVPDR